MPSSPDVAPGPDRRRATVIGAFVEGWRRVIRAPGLTVGVLVMTWIVGLPLAIGLHDQIQEQIGHSTTADGLVRGWDQQWAGEFAAGSDAAGGTFNEEMLGFGGTLATLSRLLGGQGPPWALSGAIAAYLVLWTFLEGGLIDRYARARPVRTGAFFAACGVFFFRFLRLGVLTGAGYWILFRWVRPALFGTVFNGAVRNLANEHGALVMQGWLYALFLLLMGLVSLVADFAKVRMVVEDRHSALAGLAAALRFIRRRFWRCGGLYALNILGQVVLARFWLQAAPAASSPDWIALLATQAWLLARIWARLAFMASEVVFFQGELGHAQYTARPEPIWPDSPAVEAIHNLTRRPGA